MFLEEIRQSFPEYNNDIDSIENILNEHLKRNIETLDYYTPQKLGIYGLMLLQYSLRRSKALIEGLIMAINKKNSLMSDLAVRAHIETTGVLGYFLKNLNNYYSNNISYIKMEQIMEQLIFSAKIKELKELNAPDTIGVMNLIDAADIMLKKYTDEKRYLRNIYNYLCEFCHPNFLGINMSAKEGEKISFYESIPFSNNSMVNISHLNVSCLNFILFHDEIMSCLFNKNEIPSEYFNINK